jgi:hypothetical protein
MSHGPHEGHSHDHAHTHEHASGDSDPVFDLAVPDSELEPGQLRRRGFLRGAGFLGAGVATASILRRSPRSPARSRRSRTAWTRRSSCDRWSRRVGLVLVVRPGHRAGLVPFEQPNPTPCCADHA